MSNDPPPRTAAAIAARRRRADRALAQVTEAITYLRRTKTPITVAAIARRANVSRTFLYQNPDARTAISEALARARTPQQRDLTAVTPNEDAAWRQRAHNAEHALSAAQREIRTQRERIAELLGRLRDLEQQWTDGSAQRLHTENHDLRQRVRQLTTELRTSDERLDAARSNLRFQDRRIAQLEAQIMDS